MKETKGQSFLGLIWWISLAASSLPVPLAPSLSGLLGRSLTDARGDLVNGIITEMAQSDVEERLIMLGRLLGFTRLMDAVMHNDNSPKIMAQAFIDGKYSLEGVNLE